jgi:D-alanyl-D-alanine carboxypeptidase
MKTTLIIPVITFLLSTAGPFPATAQEKVAAPAPARDTIATRRLRLGDAPGVRDALVKLDIWLEGQRMKRDWPGFSVGVVFDQELLWSKGYGFADLTNKVPATDQTLYRVASITKTFTATAVMQLVEQGRLSLDDPVSKHLPWFTPKDADPARPVLVWHLLTHTAGLQREAPGTDWDQLEGPDPNVVKSTAAGTPLAVPTQTRLKYSNYGFTVAGELVAAVSEIPYPRYVQERILLPLGMKDSLLLDGTASRPGLAVPYGRRLSLAARAVEPQMNKQGILSAGGLVSSVRDLARYASLQFNEADDFKGAVLNGRSLREMHRPRFLLPDWSTGWGLGWRLLRGEKRALIEHSGSLPGFKSKVLINPASKVAVIALINAEDGAPGELATGMMKIVAGPIDKATTPPEAPPAPTANLTRFEGLYRDRTGEYARAVVLGGKLRIITLEADDIEAATTTLRQIGPTTFRTEAPDHVFNSGVECLVEFVADASGRVTAVTMENGADRMRRVE